MLACVDMVLSPFVRGLRDRVSTVVERINIIYHVDLINTLWSEERFCDC